MLVVRAAEQPDPIGLVQPRPREPVDVIEFEFAGLGAPPTAFVGERAAAAVPFEDCPFDGVRDVARRRSVGILPRRLPILPAGREPLLRDLLNQEVERPVDDHRQISVGNPVAKQILRPAEFVAKSATGSELNLEGFLGQWPDDRPMVIRPRRWTGGCRQHERPGRCWCEDGRPWNLTDRRWNGRLRRKAGDQLLDFAFRLVGRQSQDFAVVFSREVRPEQTQSGQVHLPRADGVEDSRKASRLAGDRDPGICRVLREAELADAEREHRGECALEIQLPLVDLAEMDEELRLDAARSPDQIARDAEKLGIAERLQGGNRAWS